MKINSLTHAEEVLMHILWNLESAYLRDIMAEYPEPKPHQNTVSTFLKILVEKEFLTTQKEGRIFKYSATVPFAEYRNFLLKKFLRDYYNDSAEQLLENLIAKNLLGTPKLSKFSAEKPEEILSEPVEKENPVSEFIDEITAEFKPKKKDKKKKKKKKK